MLPPDPSYYHVMPTFPFSLLPLSLSLSYSLSSVSITDPRSYNRKRKRESLGSSRCWMSSRSARSLRPFFRFSPSAVAVGLIWHHSKLIFLDSRRRRRRLPACITPIPPRFLVVRLSFSIENISISSNLSLVCCCCCCFQYVVILYFCVFIDFRSGKQNRLKIWPEK